MSAFAWAMILKPFVLLAICLPVRYLATKYLPQGKWRDVLLRPIHRSKRQGRDVGLNSVKPAHRD